MLFDWNSSTADGYFPLNMAMLDWVKFLPFSPLFLKIFVFVTKFSLFLLNKHLRTQKDSWGKNAVFRFIQLKWLSNYTSNRLKILSNSHKNGNFLLFVTYKASSAIQWINPQANLRNRDEDEVFCNWISFDHFLRVHFGKAHSVGFFVDFFTDFVISVDILLPDDSKSRVFGKEEISDGFLH